MPQFKWFPVKLKEATETISVSAPTYEKGEGEIKVTFNI